MVIIDDAKSLLDSSTGLFVTIPILGVLVSIVYFVAKIESIAKSTAKDLKQFMETTNSRLDGHAKELKNQGEVVAILWDGHERRAGIPDRRIHGSLE
jgi:hypothetical protein